MDVSIGHLQLVGRVVGAADRSHTSGVVSLLTGPAARQRMLGSLTAAFDGDEVIVIRSMACTATVRPDALAGPDALAKSITASAARLLREHPADDDRVVRFADEAEYVAAYIQDYLEGRQDRWYYGPFLPYRRRDGGTDFAALLAERHTAVRWRILARVRRHGDLDALVDLLGEEPAEVLAAVREVGHDTGWSPLATTAAAIVGRVTGRDAEPLVADLAAALTDTQSPPDWQDANSLGGAVATATSAVLAALGVDPDEDLEERLTAAAAEHGWFDRAAFTDGLTARRSFRPATGDAAVLDPVLSPRARQVLTALATAVNDPGLHLDPTRPTSGANLVRFLATLVEADPRWEDDELARGLTAKVLDRWAGWPPASEHAEPVTTRSRPGATTALGVGPAPAVVDRAAPTHPDMRPAAVGAVPVGPDASPPSTQAVAELLNARFPRPDGTGDARDAQSAAGLLVLRGALDLGLSPYLLAPTLSGRPLLTELLDRWTGVWATDDALHGLVAQVAVQADGTPGRLRDACRLAARRLRGLQLMADPMRAVTVPHGRAGLASVAIDPAGRLLPLGTLAGVQDLDAPLAEVGVVLAGEDLETDVRATVSDLLATVSLGSGTTDELGLDLLAVSCVQAWARWLPGFADASLPFLLRSMVRRPADVDVRSEDVTVLMPSRSHDVVLKLAGYLDPLDPGPVLGGRRVRFVAGDDHGS